MSYSFNLIDQPWIPCVGVDGSFKELSLYKLLAQAHQLREIVCETVLMTSAIYPTILALLHKVYGPKNRQEWEELWSQGQFSVETLESYFDIWYDRFDLFHPQYPFYQIRDERVKPKSVIHLIHSIGNTGTLFTHANKESSQNLSPSEAARQLLTAQAFHTSGLSGLSEKFTDGPFTRGVLFWLEGETVFETLVLNLVRYPSSLLQIPHTAKDCPIWEQNDPFYSREVPYGYLDYLTWPSNRILLIPLDKDGKTVVEEMTIAPGLHLMQGIYSPQKRYSRKSEEDAWQFLYFNSDKALWRDFHSLLALTDKNVLPPAVISWLAELVEYDILSSDVNVQIVANGMLAGKAKPIFYRQEHIPFPRELLRHSEYVSVIAQAIQDAETAGQKLRDSLKQLAQHVLMRGGERKPDDKDRSKLIQQWDVLSLYWRQLEPIFWNFVVAVSEGDEDVLSLWRDELNAAAKVAFDEAIRMCGTSPWALRGQVEAERALHFGLQEVFGTGRKS